MPNLNKKIFSILFFSIFTTVTGAGIVVPLLPVYAHGLGATGIYISLIFGAFSLSRTFFLPYFGRQSDKKGRKPFIVIGLFFYAAVSVAFVIFDSVASLIALRFLQGITSAMIMPVTLAYVGDITPPGKEGFTMGMFNMSAFIGLSIGPLVGGVVNETLGLNFAFFSMAALSFTGFLFSLFLLPKTASEKIVGSRNKSLPWKILLKDKQILALFIFRLTYIACIGVIWGFFPVYADTVFSLSSARIGILVTLGVFLSGVLNMPMGFLADRINKNTLILAGGLLTCVSFIFFHFAGNFLDLIIANIFFGIGGGVATPAVMAIAVKKGHENKAMGSVMALITMAHSIGMFAGSFLAGVIMDLFELKLAFSIAGGVMLVGVLFYFVLIKQEKTTN